jgi:hypothetical protein
LANLTNLKYLGLSNLIISGKEGRASYVPDWIGGMTNLEHLDLSWNTGLACLPASIGNLKRFHTLDLTKCWSLKSLPESIPALGLKSLVLHNCSDELVDQASSLVHFSQTLPDFKVRADDVNRCSNLHLLEGINVSELRISSLENVRSLEEANKVKLFENQNLSELRLAWTRDVVRLLEDKDLLGQLVPPRSLKHICLKGYNSAGFPGWLMGTSRHLINLVSIQLSSLPTCSNLPPLGQLPHLEKLSLYNLPSIKRIDREFCGGHGAFRKLSSFEVSHLFGLEEWNTAYSVEDGVDEFMFPVLDTLTIFNCPRLRLKPCPPTFCECKISLSDQVVSSMESVDQSSRPCSPSRAIKLDLEIDGNPCQSMRLLHHFPALRELRICGSKMQMTSLPESMLHLTSLESLTLASCLHLSALPEWLGDLSSLRSLVIERCWRIKSLPSCIQLLPKLQKIFFRKAARALPNFY